MYHVESLNDMVIQKRIGAELLHTRVLKCIPPGRCGRSCINDIQKTMQTRAIIDKECRRKIRV